MKRDIEFHRKRAEAFTEKLSLQDKINIFYGTAEDWERLGLSMLDFAAEAAHGVQARHDQSFDLGEPICTTVFPSPIGMASSFDKKLMHRIGEVVGTETRSLANEGLHNGLCPFAPTIDMERDPRWGRNEEAYGEDPHLASRLAGEYVLGMAGDDPDYVRCGATLKHFYANNVENKRFMSDSRMPEDLKEDYYLRVFKEMIEYSGPLSVMSSYNFINGVAATFNPEIRQKLKAWGVPFVVSDAFTMRLAVDQQHSAEDGCDALKKAFEAGVDLFLEDGRYERPFMEEALNKGIITEDHLTEAIVNRMTVFSMLGLMAEDQGEDGCTRAFPKDKYNSSKVDTAENRALAREAASKTVVLLKNDGMLPVACGLKEEAVEDNQLVGENNIGKQFAFGPFVNRCPIDWYGGLSSHIVTFTEGMNIPGEELFPVVKLVLYGASDKDDNNTTKQNRSDVIIENGSTETGKTVERKYAGIRDGKVVPVSLEEAELFRIMLWDESRITIRSLSTGKLLTTISPDKKIKNIEEVSDTFELYANADDAFSWFTNEAFQLYDENGEVIRFTADDALHFWENEQNVTENSDNRNAGNTVIVENSKNDSAIIRRSRNIKGITNPDGKMALCFETVKDVETILSETIEQNNLNSDTDIFACFGLHPIVNMKEERDRESIELPPFQRAVLRKLRQTFKNIALVLIGNAPIAVAEEDEAPEIRSILWSAFGCEEIGNGLADVITGRVSPAGRTSQTWYRDDSQLGDIEDYDIRKTGMTYLYMTEKPLYRFGYGLSYTTFESKLLENKVRVINTGSFTSDHVVQVYESPDGEYFLYDNDRDCRDVSGREIPTVSRLVFFERMYDVKPGEEVFCEFR